jgi:hypothetical protein
VIEAKFPAMIVLLPIFTAYSVGMIIDGDKGFSEIVKMSLSGL